MDALLALSGPPARALEWSAREGKADIAVTLRNCPLLTQSGHLDRAGKLEPFKLNETEAHHPLALPVAGHRRIWFCPEWRGDEATRFHQSTWNWGGRLANCCAGATDGDAGGLISGRGQSKQRGAAC
jgi:hypothetical protein